MTFIESLLKELDRESITTRKMLERVPADKYDWKPHEKSMPLRELAGHVAEIPTWLCLVLNSAELDFATLNYQPPHFNNTNGLMTLFDESLAAGKKALTHATDKQLEDIWIMRSGEKIHSRETKEEAIRGCFCQVVHHRAQLGVYLRLLNVPIPGSYGPSADEPNF